MIEGLISFQPLKVTIEYLAHLREKLSGIRASVDVVTDIDDGMCMLRQYEEQITDLKKELKEIQTPLLVVDLETSHPLTGAQDAVERDIFECSLAIKKHHHSTVVV